MPYINADGSVTAQPPLLRRAQNFFWGFVNFITIFFRTLINPSANSRGSNYVTDYSSSSGNGGPPRPPQRRMGGFKTLSDCKAPPMAGGG